MGSARARPAPAPVPAAPATLPLRRSSLGRRIGGCLGRVVAGLFLGSGFLLLRLLVLVRLQQVGGVQKRALLLPDIDEGGLDAGKHRLHPAQVDVPHRAAVVGAVYQELHQSIVFQDRHPGFPLASVDQDLTLQV